MVVDIQDVGVTPDVGGGIADALQTGAVDDDGAVGLGRARRSRHPDRIPTVEEGIVFVGRIVEDDDGILTHLPEQIPECQAASYSIPVAVDVRSQQEVVSLFQKTAGSMQIG